MPKFESAMAEGSAAKAPPEKTRPHLRVAGPGDKPRDLIELPEEAMKQFEKDTARMDEIKAQRRRDEIEEALKEGMKTFDEKSAELELARDATLNRHLAIAAEAKREAERIRDAFRAMSAPYENAWELMLKLRKYDVELEDALYEADERPALQRELPAAREERKEIVTARKQIEHVLKKIQKAVEHGGSEREEESVPEDAEALYAEDLKDQARIRDDLEKGLIDADARGALELELRGRAERIETRLKELNAVSKDRAADPETAAAFKAAVAALKDTHETLHALFEEDRKVIREAEEELTGTTEEDIDAAIEQMESQKITAEEIADALDNLKAGELQQIPGNIEATREKYKEVSSLAEHIRGEIGRQETEGAADPNPFGAELVHLDRLASELDERLELLYGKNEYTKDEKKEFEIIADAKHLIQDLRHEMLTSYEQRVPQKDVAAERALEQHTAAYQVKKRRLESLAEEITSMMKKNGVKNPDVYLAFQSAGALGGAKRLLGKVIGRKYPKLSDDQVKAVQDKLTRIQMDFETEYYTKKERMKTSWQKKVRDRARLNTLSPRANLFDLWKAIHEEIEDVSVNVPPSLAPALTGEGEAKARVAASREQEEQRREQRGAASEAMAQFGLGAAKTEEEFFMEPEEIVNQKIEAAEKAGIKDAKKIWDEIMTDPAAADMKYHASEIIDQMILVSEELAREKLNKDALHQATLTLAEMQEDLGDHMGGIKAVDGLILKANRALAKKRNIKKLRPSVRKGKAKKVKKAA